MPVRYRGSDFNPVAELLVVALSVGSRFRRASLRLWRHKSRLKSD